MRAFAWFVGAILLAGVIGALVAYPAYELTSTFASWAFHRVMSRIAMLVLILELVWVCRHLHLTSKRDFGYGLPWAQIRCNQPDLGSHRHTHRRRRRFFFCSLRTCACRSRDSPPPRPIWRASLRSA